MSDAISTVSVGGVPFTSRTAADAANWIIEASRRGETRTVRFANAWSVVCAADDPDYRSILGSTGTNFPDGTPIALIIGLISRSRQLRRARGPSTFELALKASVTQDVRHFFMGTTETTLERLVNAANERYPGINIAGTWAPPFGPPSDSVEDEAARRITSSGANLVWVGMGTPKQDFVATRLALRCGVVTAGVGAAFDFMAGTVRECPPWLRSIGLEWLFRLLAEPRRLWRRYLVGNLRFLMLTVPTTIRSIGGSSRRASRT